MGQLLLLVHVENLEDVSLSALDRRPQGHDILLEVHDAAVDLGAGPADDVELIEEFDGGELRGAVLVSVADGDVSLGLEVSDVELEVLGVDAQRGQVLDLSELEGNHALHSNQLMMISHVISTTFKLTYPL